MTQSKNPKKPLVAPSDLSHRTKRILHAVVSEYLSTGEAVGSRTVTRRQGINLSPATVRNVMADLEELGLLDQPHVSAGRVPTNSGLRFFIDCLLKVRSLSAKEKEEIRARCGIGTLEMEEVMRQTSRTLSEVTHCAGIVLSPNPAVQRLRHLEFVPLASGEFLCILVTAEGYIQNKLIRTDVKVDPSRLERIHNYLMSALEGLSLAEVRSKVLAELGEDKNRYDGMIADALKLGHEAFKGVGQSNVIVSGGANLLDGISDEEAMAQRRDLLRTLEDKEVLASFLDKAMSAERIQVFLGAESEVDSFGDTSVVAMPYVVGDKTVGAIAVVGPTRMNYGKVMSVVDFTAQMVSLLMGEG
jgi:heat-inducible transcriptional repressor